MAAQVFADNAKVMSKGQVTIPKDVRNVLGVGADDKVTFIVEGNVVRMVRSSTRAVIRPHSGSTHLLKHSDSSQAPAMSTARTAISTASKSIPIFTKVTYNQEQSEGRRGW